MKHPVDKFEKDIFYSDYNITKLPLFTASNKGGGENQVVNIDGTGDVLPLTIEYGEKRPGWAEQKALWAIEYVFGKRFDFNSLQESFKGFIEIAKSSRIEAMKEGKWKKKDIDTIDEADEQFIILSALEMLRAEKFLTIDLGMVADLMYPGLHATSFLSETLKILNTTFILPGTKLYIGKKRKNLSVDKYPIINIIMETSGTNRAGIATIRLNPFHIYNLMMKRVVSADIGFILRIDKPVAGMAYKYLLPHLYGVNQRGNTTYSFSYSDFCVLAQIEEQIEKVRIKASIGPGLDELVDKKFIEGWSLVKETSGYNITVITSELFYKEFYDALDQDEKDRIEKIITDLPNEKYAVMIDDFIASSTADTLPEKKQRASYYARYLASRK